jgi:hypothetical protein
MHKAEAVEQEEPVVRTTNLLNILPVVEQEDQRLLTGE